MGAPDAGPASTQGRHLNEVIGRIEASLAGGAFRVTRDSVAGRQAVIGRASRLGRRPLFVLVALFKGGMAGREHLDRFSEEAGQYAATLKGRLSAGATALAVAVVETVEERCAEWALGPGSTYPVLVDLAGGTVRCPDTPPDLRRLVREHIEPSMRLV